MTKDLIRMVENWEGLRCKFFPRGNKGLKLQLSPETKVEKNSVAFNYVDYHNEN